MEHREFIRLVPGSRTAVLMIHGIAGTPDHFDMFMDLIPEDWSVFDLLLHGHGKEVRDFGHSSMAQWKAQVSQRLEALLKSYSRVLILAHSMGTLFAIREAVERPGAILGLFLLSCPMRVHYPPRTMLLSIRTALGSKRPDSQAMRADCSIRLTPYLWQYIGWAPRFLELLKEISQVRRLLPRLETPALCFHACRDQLVTMEAVRDLENCPAVKMVLLENSSHFAYSPPDAELLRQQWVAFARQLTGEDFPV